MLQALHGPLSLIIACLLLYAEEAGLPIPFAPGEAILIGIGLLIASGALPLWLALPALYVAILAGATTGYAWSRVLGRNALQRLAERLGAGPAFARISDRLRGATVLEIASSRLLPGLRIYTSLVAGAVGVSAGRFLPAVAPAAAVWVIVFTLLGVFVGIPAEHLLGRVEALALRAAVVLALLLAGYLLLERVPRVGHWPAPSDRPRLWRQLVAVAVDLGLVGLVMAGLGVLTGLESLEPSSSASTVVLAGIFFLVYLAVARRVVGATAGEVLLRVRYP